MFGDHRCCSVFGEGPCLAVIVLLEGIVLLSFCWFDGVFRI